MPDQTRPDEGANPFNIINDHASSDDVQISLPRAVGTTWTSSAWHGEPHQAGSVTYGGVLHSRDQIWLYIVVAIVVRLEGVRLEL
ncbi:hypothetical protein DAEQUDRAFT_731522 [Daedalea quercina L-15889]|uniref:Uncharacterized protein n=1 Tax=Daedalea quercina L-15889 TaxID=1314783 RepID=A0A165M8M8_9APHY|nr:hypothetical protein DAEQUDRAFT_731522 [Daedalea quercina L-15889]